jgi:hypothetical protein
MKKHLHTFLSLALLLIFSIGVLANGFQPKSAFAASGGKIYMDPASGSFTTGGTFAVRVYVSSPSPINAAFVNIYYNGRGLQYLSAQRGGGFPNQNAPTQHTAGDTGVIKMQSTRNTTISGDFHYATLTFKATSAGTWGVRPGTDSSIINYPSNTVSFTTGRADFVVSNPVVQPPIIQPTQPTKPSTPTPTPKPTTPTRSPTGGSPQATPTTPVSSEASETGLQITDLTVTEIDYRTALISWNTTKPSSSKINFSDSQEDLYNEKLNDQPNTAHSIKLEGEDVRAGKHYYVRVTANDGASEPVTLDTEFDTKPVSVVIKVTDTSDQPVNEALVQAGDAEAVTDENGEVTLDLPEGTVTIFAQKDELSKELEETIEVPTDENLPRFTLALSKTVAAAKVTIPKKKSTPWLAIILPIVLLGGGIVGFLLWRKRNIQKANAYYGDPLEAENYTGDSMPTTPAEALPQEAPVPHEVIESQQPIDQPKPSSFPAAPPMPEPTYLPVEDPRIPHHATLPELLGRYGTEAAEDDTSTSTNAEVASPTGQHIPNHISLKQLVETPKPKQKTQEPDLQSPDLPASPISAQTIEQEDNEPPKKKHRGDGSLTIEH